MAGVTSYIALGANLGDCYATLVQALQAIHAHPEMLVDRCSSFYASKPMGPQDQPDYLNAVAAVQTTLTPTSLLSALQAIEQHHGRTRERHWGARTLDLDIALYGNQTVNLPHLCIPHAGLQERDFVLKPLFELAPELELPDGRSLEQLLTTAPDYGLIVRHPPLLLPTSN